MDLESKRRGVWVGGWRYSEVVRRERGEAVRRGAQKSTSP